MSPFPEEVDVFTAPHSRMKELVEVYSVKLHCTDFSNNEALESLLNSLDQTFSEFKTHEQIENKFIMNKLKKKLKTLHIQDSAVCNCHNDSQLSDMLALVKDGYSCANKSLIEKINYGLKLQHALEGFTKEFLPHMKEEEEVFQPMLMKYFNYDELRSLKELVLKEHTKWRNQILSVEKHSIETKEKEDVKNDYISSLPPELLNHIFSFLTPLEKVICSGVSKSWNRAAYDKNLWTKILPTRWSRGIWNSNEIIAKTFACKQHSSLSFDDEDADIDESDGEISIKSCSVANCQFANYQSERNMLSALIQHVLPRVGSGVRCLDLGSSSALTNDLLRSLLILCPEVQWLDVSDTRIGDAAFKGLAETNACRHLEYMDLAGCQLTDQGMLILTKCLTQSKTPLIASSKCSSQSSKVWKLKEEEDWLHPIDWCFECPVKRCSRKPINSPLKSLSLSGCYGFTDYGLSAMARAGLFANLRYLDLSGCFQLSGEMLKQAVEMAGQLEPADLYYCNDITNGPYETEANGCQNLGNGERFCCRSD